MNTKKSIWIVSGAVGVAAAAGVTYAVMQPSSQPTVSSTSQSPSPQAIATAPEPSSPSAKPTVAPKSATEAGSKTDGAASSQTTDSGYKQPTSATNSATVSRKVEFCKVGQALVKDPNPPLNVRSAPNTAAGVVGQLKNGTWVSVREEENGWFQISDPVAGWISKRQTDSNCNRKIERVNFEPGKTYTTIADRFVGTGNHRYVLTLKKGQRISITSSDGPFPTLLTPDGKLMAGDPGIVPDPSMAAKQSNWTGQLPQSGDYTVELDSNFKGYKYEFLVEVE